MHDPKHTRSFSSAASRGFGAAAVCIALSAPLAAASLLVAELPWSHVWALPVPLASLLPASLALAAGLELVLFIGARVAHRIEPLLPCASRWGIAGMLGAAVFLAGGVAANLIFVDEPVEGNTLWGYAASAAAAALFMLAVLRSARIEAFLRGPWWPRTFVFTAFASGVLLAMLDATVLSAHYDRLHRVLAGVALGSFVVAYRAALSPIRVLGRHSIAALGVVVLGAAVTALGMTWHPETRAASVRAAMSHGTVHRRVVAWVREVTDRDGDGFSAWLGGGDCDDADPSAYPLSIAGDPCLELDPNPEPPPPLRAQAAAGAPPPRVLLLLTIDALRCGFAGAVSERPELRDICPELTRLGNEGLLRPDAHAVYPATVPSLQAIHGVGRTRLADALGELGYHRVMVPGTPHVLGNPESRGHYDVVRNDAYETECSADLITELTLDEIRRGLAEHERVFAWAHYYDPHAPYLRDPSDSLVLSPDIDRYVAEVRRTDAAIGALARALANDPALADAAILLTADHAEEFGDHGGDRHGANLYETSVRIPMVAWRAGEDARRGLPEILPFGSDQVGEYVHAVASGRPFTARSQTAMSVSTGDYEQLGIVVGRQKLIYSRTWGYLELFDLEADPFERTNLAEARPQDTRRLLGLLYRSAAH